MTGGSESYAPSRLFYSYSHKDEEFREQLEEHLALLRRGGMIEEWHDRMIGAGTEWEGQIDDNLEQADVILLLISSSFIASDFCFGKEMTRAMERHDAGEARVIPVIIRSCDWYTAPFGKLQALPKDGKPVNSWSDVDEAFTDVAKGIGNAVQILRQPASKSKPPTAVSSKGIFVFPHRGPARIPEEAWLSTYNFHDKEAVDRLVSLLRQESAESRIVYVVGEDGSGRRYLVEAAVHEARKTASKLRRIALDFDGYETSDDFLERYAGYQATKHALPTIGIDQAARELQRRLVVRGPSLELCTIYSIAIQIVGSASRLSRFFDRYLPRSAERLQPTQALAVLLEQLTDEGPLVFHLLDIVQVPSPFVQWCGQQVMIHPSLVVVLSGPLETGGDKLLPGIQSTRFEIAPFERSQLQETLATHFGDVGFAESLTQMLWINPRHTRFQTGVTLHAICEKHVIDQVGGKWTFSRSTEDDHALVNVLKEDYWDRLFGLCLEHDDLQEFLELAALV